MLMKSKEHTVRSKRLFSKEKLEEMQKQFLDLVLEALERGDIETAKYWVKRHRSQQHWFFDSYLHGCTALGTYIYKHMGEEAIFEAMTQAVKFFAEGAATLRKNVSGGDSGGDEGVKAYVECIADLWRQHYGEWTIEEDDEKFTFTQDPCGSGGRLIDMGAYEGPYGYAVIKNAHPITWGEKNIPLYCLHCSIANEIIPLIISGEGSQIWIHDTPCARKPGDKCVHFIYKDPKKIPEKYYKRLGLPRQIKKTMDIY
jgi:hypothetical protein